MAAQTTKADGSIGFYKKAMPCDYPKYDDGRECGKLTRLYIVQDETDFDLFIEELKRQATDKLQKTRTPRGDFRGRHIVEHPRCAVHLEATHGRSYSLRIPPEVYDKWIEDCLRCATSMFAPYEGLSEIPQKVQDKWAKICDRCRKEGAAGEKGGT
jgi:hypothetical protein